MEDSLATTLLNNLGSDAVEMMAIQYGLVSNRTDRIVLPLVVARAYLMGEIDDIRIANLLPIARRSYELAIANSIHVRTAPRTHSNLVTGPSGSDSNPYSRLTDQMLRIVSRSLSLDLDGIPRQYALDILRDASPPPTSSISGLLYEAAFVMGLDFTRDPYGQLSLLDSVMLINFIKRSDKLRGIDSVPREILYLAALYLYPAYEPELLTTTQIKHLFRGKSPIPSRKVRQRRTKLLNLPADVIRLYLQLYNTEFFHFPVISEPHPIENYIDHIPVDYQQVIQALGIIVPTNRQPRDYLMDNIIQYAPVVEQPSTPDMDQRLLQDRHNATIYLAHYTDRDMVSLLGILPHYDSRTQLVRALADLLGGNPSFFFPVVRRCKNAETYYLNSTNDTDIDIIAYGTYNEYTCYEPDELLANVHTRFVSFPGTTIIMDKEQLKQLHNLIEPYRQVADVYRQLLDRVKDILEMGNVAIPELRAMIAPFDDWIKDTIRNFLLSIFRTGMYMRRWTGSGCYPVTMEQTIAGINPEPLSIQGLLESRDLYENLPLEAKVIMNSLQAVGTNHMFMDRFNLVLQGEASGSVESCIRMSSNTFIRTAYHYLLGLFDYRIPDFDINQLTSIS